MKKHFRDFGITKYCDIPGTCVRRSTSGTSWVQVTVTFQVSGTFIIHMKKYFRYIRGTRYWDIPGIRYLPSIRSKSDLFTASIVPLLALIPYMARW